MNNIKLFESKQIRTVWNQADEQWYFVVADVIQVLTDTPNPGDYIKKMRKRDEGLSKGWGQFVTPLPVDTSGGKQKLNCANAKGLLRIIQAIPSPKAEPFKLWLAQVGSDRLDEIENPEMAMQWTRELYKLKGYSDREKVVKNYIDGYNHFDIDKMMTDFDESIFFENVQNGEVNMSLSGISAFKQQAEQAKSYFIARQQIIKLFTHKDDETEIVIDYSAVLAMDFPNGLKKGETLNLTGKSVFKFSDNKIIKLIDIS